MKTITFHSYKGGTGKSYLASNIAAVFAEKEKICLLDVDLSAPTLQRLFNLQECDLWLNDYLDGECGISDVLLKVGNGDLFLGMANPRPEVIRAELSKSKEREMRALKKLLSVKKALAEVGFDMLVLDTCPGYEYASINSIATADTVGVVMTLYRPDLLGTKEMVGGLYEVLEKPAFIIVNRYHSAKLLEKFKSDVRGNFKGRVFGMECFCEETEELGNKVITLESPSHPLSRSIRQLAQEIALECEC